MAIGTMTKTLDGQFGNTGPVNFNLVSFAGDGSYPTGGTAGFQATVRALFKDAREIVGIEAQDCGGYVPVYDKAADKLKVYQCAGSAAPMSEVPNATNLSAVTFRVLVRSK
jgi:hypothetical protein